MYKTNQYNKKRRIDDMDHNTRIVLNNTPNCIMESLDSA